MQIAKSKLPHHGSVSSWCRMFTIIFDNIGEQKKD